MNNLFFLIPFLGVFIVVAAVVPGATAQQAPTVPVITVGQNYDLIEDYQLGVATWSSHPERIFDGSDWKDFIVYDRSSIIQVESESIGSLVYDKDSCSYSIYEAGYVSPGTQIIPAVSWMPRIAEVGTDNYSQLDNLFNAQCDVQVSQGESWVNIKSVKTQTEDLDPLVIVHANGTQSVYPSGTRDVAVMTQTLQISTERGIKETVSVFNGNPEWSNHKFALSQTIHTGDSITLGGNTYDIAGNSGTVLDRQWIEDNEAQIFEIADSLSYDFDVGIQQLNAIQILNDFGTNKVSMDFSVNESTPYLSSYTVDPTFTAGADTVKRVYDNGATGSSCDPTGTASDSTGKIQRPLSSGAGTCQKMSYQWDLSSITSPVIISDSDIDINITGTTNMASETCSFYPMTQDLGTATVDEIYDDATDGTAYVNGITCSSTGMKNVDLGTVADSDISTTIAGDQKFEIGFWFESQTRDGSTREATMGTPTLTVSYTLPTQPSAPTNLSSTDGIPIDLSWTASSDLGGAATGDMTYKVERSTYEFAESPLPINAGSDSAVDMSTNKLLYHLDATKTDTTTSTFTDDGSSTTGWTSPQNILTSSNGKLNISTSSGGAGYYAVKDLGFTIDNDFTLTFEMEYTGGSGDEGGVVIWDSSVLNPNVTGDRTKGIYAQIANTGQVWGLIYDGSSFDMAERLCNTGGTGSAVTLSTGQSTNIKIEKSGTDITYTIDNNADFGSPECVHSGTTSLSGWDEIALLTRNSNHDYTFDDLYVTTSSTSDPYIEDTSGANNDSENPNVTELGTLDIDEDFTTPTYTWTQVGSAIQINNGQIEASNLGGTEARVHTPATISDDKWIMQFDYEVTHIGTDSEHSPFVVSAGTDVIRQTSQDYIGFDIYNPPDTLRMNYRDGSTNGYGGSMTGIQTNTPYYVTMKKDGTTVTLSLFTDSARTTHESGSPLTMTVPSTVSGMTHIQSTGWVGSSANGSHSEWTVDNLQFCDGETDWANCYPTTTSNPTFSSGTIANQIDDPKLTVKSSTLFDGTDAHSVAGWTSATQTRDSSFDGTNNGATTQATGKIGSYAWDFDTTNDYVDTNSKFNFLHDGSGGSISVWVQPHSFTNWTPLIASTGGQSSTTGFDIIWDDAQKPYCRTINTSNQWQLTIAGSSLSTNTWYHVACTIDSSEIKTYVDGTLVSTHTISGTLKSGDSTYNTYIGDGTWTTGTDGLVDQVLVYDTVLSASDVTALYNSGSGTSTPSTTNLIAHYDFEQTGSTLENQIYEQGTGTLLSFENTSGETISYEIETGKVRVVKSSTTSIVQGNEGAGVAQSSGHAGGGGGAGTPASNQNGGDGKASSITGSSVNYAGGGGGAGTSGGTGGTGGGGNGGNGSSASQCGTNGLGGGAGGGGNVGSNCGDGGSGVVIVSYPTADLTATGGTVTTSGSNTIHTFSSGSTSGTTGTFTVSSGSTSNGHLLIVGGGGGTATSWGYGGGGGAGGFIELTSYSLSSGSYSIVVGAGGTGSTGTNTAGGDSSFGTITASGGGAGGKWSVDHGNGLKIGGDGGSGGGNHDSTSSAGQSIPLTLSSTTNIIEATGQSISTSTPSHVMFTRDTSNGWEIFLDGTSIQTATDSTSLGTATGISTEWSNDGSTSSDWSQVGSYARHNTDKITYGGSGYGDGSSYDTTNHEVSAQLGSTTSGDVILRYKLTFDDRLNDWLMVGIGLEKAQGTHYISSNADSFHVDIRPCDSTWACSSNPNANHELVLREDNYSTISGTTLHTDATTGDDRWIEMKRVGSTATLSIYTDSTYSTLDTDPDTSSNLTGSGTMSTDDEFSYFELNYHNGVGGTKNGQLSVDDIGVCNGSSWASCEGSPTYYIGSTKTGTNTLPSLDEFAIWTSDKGSEASDIYDRGANQFAQVGTTTGSTVTFSDNNSLVSGSEYFHRIIANNGAFDSDPSNVSQSTAGVPPDAPTNLQASINNPNTAPLDVTLTWSDGANQGTGVFQNYIVIRSPDSTFSTVATVGTPTGTTYTDTVPSGGGTFYYKVSDQSSHGGSPNSAAASVTTPTVPDAPTISLAINNPDPSPLTITTTFTAPANDGGSAITGYHLFHSTDDVTYNQVAINTASPHDHTVSGVGTHYFKAQAVNLVGASVDSTAQSIATPTAPGAPASLTITLPDVDTAPFTVTLDWTAPANNGGSAVTGYKVYRDSTLLATLGNVLTYSDTTPSNASTVFNFEVTAINNAAEGTAVSQSWTSPAVPSQVQGLGGNVFNQAVILTWQMPQSDSAITDFEVFRSGSSYAFVGSNSTTYTDSANIIPDSSITYAVKGISLVGTGAASSDALVSTGSGAVLDLTSTNIIENSLVLTWTEPTYAAGSVLGYMINYTTPYGTPDTILVSDTQTTVTVQPLSNLAYSANYTFTVGTITPLGVNASGNWHTVQTNEDLSITSFNVTQGFDIEAVNTQEIDQIKFDRVENSDGTTTLDVIHPTYYNIYCNLDSKFAMTNQNYTNLSTTVISGQDQKASFVFTDLDNDVITIKCTDTVTNDNAIYILTQNNFPILDQIANFKAGEYGTAGLFGVLDLVTLFIVIISMIGFNRINESVGAIFNFILLGGTAYFGIIELPTAIFGAMAVVLMLVITTTRKK